MQIEKLLNQCKSGVGAIVGEGFAARTKGYTCRIDEQIIVGIIAQLTERQKRCE
jgi:hypothetical protein